MALFNFTDKSILYFPGCFSTSFLEKKIENYRKILRKLGINPRFEPEFRCCGCILKEAGYEKQFRKLARENLEFLEKNNIKKIITSCPRCFKTLAQDYKEALPNWNIEVEFILDSILAKLEENPKLIKNVFIESITYYDSCYLARYSGFTEVPRMLLRIFGYNLIELPYTKEETLCCGSCGNLDITNPELADKIAIDFIRMLNHNNIKKIVTADDRAYLHLKKNLSDSNKIKIIDFSELACNSLGIRPELDLEKETTSSIKQEETQTIQENEDNQE